VPSNALFRMEIGKERERARTGTGKLGRLTSGRLRNSH
jgi:hypothetical protein